MIIGKKGVDDFVLKYADGTTEPWPTDEEMTQWEKDFPALKGAELEEFVMATQKAIGRCYLRGQ